MKLKEGKEGKKGKEGHDKETLNLNKIKRIFSWSDGVMASG